MSSESSNSWLLILALVVGLASAFAGALMWRMMQGPQQISTAALFVLPEPRAIEDFSLTDVDGKQFSLENLQDKWTLIFFGFTHCPDVCPSTLYDLQLVHKDLVEYAGGSPLSHQVLFISVDPERDTPQKLRDYLAYFDPDFIGATAGHDQLMPLTRQLSIAYRIEDHEPGEPLYSVDHSASLLLMDPRGQMFGVFTAPLDAKAISADMAAVIDSG